MMNKTSKDDFTGASTFNQLNYLIEQKIKEMVNTSALVRVDSVSDGTVSATPLVCQTDTEGNAVKMVSIPRMPYHRLQGGVAAIIIDPVAGDIGVANFCKHDSSTIGTGESEPQRAGSFRVFDEADGIYAASTLNPDPTVYIRLNQDNTIDIVASGGVTVSAPTVTVTGDVVAGGVSLMNHTHPGDSGGTTGTPN